MNSDDEQDNCNEDQIINLISALQQKSISFQQLVKTNRANTDMSNSMINRQPQKNHPLKISNEFSLQGEQSKHSSISENLSDIVVRTDKQIQRPEQKQETEYDLRQKVDYLIQQRERDRELMEQMNAGLMFLISQLPKPKQTNTVGVQTIQQPQQQLTPNKKRTAQQTVQAMFQEPDRYALQEIRNFCLKR